MSKTLLIAETDDENRVVALWRAGGGLRAPRPVKTPDEARELLIVADIEGAAQPEVAAWIARWTDAAAS